MKIVCISDTHNSHRDVEIPNGDILIHAGDFSFQGEPRVYRDADKWFGELPHKYKFIIAGNHDFNFYRHKWKNAIPLCDSGMVIDGVRFWGSPYSPTFGNWAWMKDRGDEIAKHWKMIPDNTDVVIAHGPAYELGDKTPPRWGSVNAGCYDLGLALDRIKPKLFVCGHIHNGYGKYERKGAVYVNASVCNEDYDPINPAIVVNLEPPAKEERND